MPQYKKISELPELTDLSQDQYTIVYDSQGNSRKVKLNNMATNGLKIGKAKLEYDNSIDALCITFNEQ